MATIQTRIGPIIKIEEIICWAEVGCMAPPVTELRKPAPSSMAVITALVMPVPILKPSDPPPKIRLS